MYENYVESSSVDFMEMYSHLTYLLQCSVISCFQCFQENSETRCLNPSSTAYATEVSLSNLKEVSILARRFVKLIDLVVLNAQRTVEKYYKTLSCSKISVKSTL